MNQIMKDKMKRKIMVVASKVLFNGINRESRFYSNSEVNFEERILKNYEYMIRGEAEINFNYKQSITYAAVVNEKKEIFVYKR